jgi:hypothetical protein
VRCDVASPWMPHINLSKASRFAFPPSLLNGHPDLSCVLAVKRAHVDRVARLPVEVYALTKVTSFKRNVITASSRFVRHGATITRWKPHRKFIARVLCLQTEKPMYGCRQATRNEVGRWLGIRDSNR